MGDSLIPVSPPAVGDRLAGKYRIDGVLGEGGMGIVYDATQEMTRKRVAIKWLRPDLLEASAAQRALREAQASARIQHPNVIDIYDVGKHKGCLYLVMEHMHGETLSALLERGPLDPAAAIHILMPVLRGVAFAHRQGVIHRDLKPSNIFLTHGPDGELREVKVLDFGISKLLATQGQEVPSLTRSGTLLGTPCYMSPEQIADAKGVDIRTDVYALGVVLFEMLTGRLPFRSTRLTALIVEITAKAPIRLREVRPELPEALEAMITKAMARDPADRYPDLESLARALERFAPGATFHTDPTGGHALERRDKEPARAAHDAAFARTEVAADSVSAADAPPAELREKSVSIRVPMYSLWPALAIACAIVVLVVALAFWRW